MKKQITSEQALVKAQNICASQEKCIFDIRKKLFDWNIPTSKISEIIDSLVNDKFIDEERYTNFYVRDKIKLNKWGKIKIIFSLKQKQIDQTIINHTINEIDTNEYKEILKNELIKKLKSLKNEEPHKLKEKLLRFAAGRGFEADLCILMVENLLD